jgi:ABC-type sugar transport system ATPase subunit/ribose/xylose/arabinose/galactoside ABC-type transport system permease subunit
MPDALLEVTRLVKTYGGVRALDGVSLDVLPAEVHALCGENGAGKSTLNRILCGAVRPDAGDIRLNGHPAVLGSVPQAEAAGIAIVHQESATFADLDAVDNVFLMREVTRLAGLWLDRPAMRARTLAILRGLGEDFPADMPLDQLRLSQRQMVGIARALARECRLLILDEPTASLSSREVEALFRVVRELRSNGVAVLYVSHRLEEVFALSDRVTVLRDGRLVGTWRTAETNREGLIQAMVGRSIEATLARSATSAGEPGLSIEVLSRCGAFENVSFQVRKGEIVALSGLVGAGRSEVARAIFGVAPYDSGRVSLDGKPLPPGRPGEAIERGLVYLPEDRQHEGLHLPFSVRQNLNLAVLRFRRGIGWRQPQLEAKLSRDMIQGLGIRAPGDRTPVHSLSGGNQQKTLFGKWLAAEPRALILDEPTRGVDVGAKAEIHRRIRTLADEGAAVAVISSELPEVQAVADRVLVFRQGRIAGELSKSEATPERLLALALPDEAQSEKSSKARSRLPSREVGLAAFTALMFLAVSIANPGFASLQNLRDLLVSIAPAAIVACGLAFVVLAREIDISMGSLMGLCSATLGIVSAADRMGLHPALGVAACLSLGAAVGLLNGVLVANGRVPSIIATLGMLTVLSGVTELLLGGKWITGMPPGLREFGTGALLGIPNSVLTAAAVAVASFWLAGKTAFGRRIYALGSHPEAALTLGLPVQRLKLAVFAWTGFLASVAALFSATQLQVIEAGFGKGIELAVVAAVVVGGVSIRGGKGTIVGVLLGAALLGSVKTMLIFLRLGESAVYWERAIQGGLILLAVLSDHFLRRREAAG